MNNFLSIVWYRVLPPQYGGQKGIAHFNYYLGKKVTLTCLCSRNNAVSEKLSYKLINKLPASKFQFWNPFVRNRILSLIRKERFTHIIIEHPWHGWLGTYKKHFGFKLIVHAHNIEHLRIKARNKFWWRTLKKTEQTTFGMADLILFKKEEDKETAIKLFNVSREKCLLVPYGTIENKPPVTDIETKERVRKKHNADAGEKLILFAGTLDYEPNARAIDKITDHIIPILQKKGFRFKLIICGALPEQRMSQLNAIPGLAAAGFVSSVEDYLRSADVFINPVLDGSGIQTKSIEAIANRCNVVSTAFAATGLPGYLYEKKLYVSTDNDWDRFADNIIKAASNTEFTPPRFYHDYNWETIIDDLLRRIGANVSG